ncbi:MAG TPA: cytochrome c [Stellaceae bacterium]|nr:cytochrome c [Stellaceae bacterium]
MRTLVLAVCCGALLTGPAQAGDADAGRVLAQTWCANCHVVGGATQGQDAAPPLAAIAQRRGQDPNWLRAWLTAPHPPMPNLNLSRAEIEDLVAYLASLAPATHK